MDESGFAHDMPRTHGYAQKGDRCFGTQDWGVKGRVNVFGALVGSALIATAGFQTTIHTNVFDAWVSQDLVKHLPKTRVFVMDNATFHQGARMQKTLEEQGHTLVYSQINLICVEKRRAKCGFAYRGD